MSTLRKGIVLATITVDYATYLTGAPYNSADTVIIADTSTVLNALTTSQIDALSTNNVDQLSSTSGSLSWSAAQVSHLCAGTTIIAAATVSALIDTGTNIAALSSTVFGQLHTHGIDSIDASDDALTLSLAQYNALGTTTLTQADTVTLSDTQTNIQNLSGATFNTAITKGIDVFHSTSGSLTVSTSQLGQMIHNVSGTFVDRAHFQASDTVTWASTGSDIASGGNIGSVMISAMQAGVDFVHATDGVLTLVAEQFLDITLYGGAKLVTTDNDSISDSNDNLQNLWSATGLNSLLSGSGVDTISSYDDYITITAAGVAGVDGSGTVLSADTVTVSDTGAKIAALNFADLAGLGINGIDATDNIVYLSQAQFAALGSITVDASDTLYLYDTAANLSALTTDAISGLSARFTTIKVSDGQTLNLTIAQLAALSARSMALTPGDTVALHDTQANIQALSDTAISAYITQGVDIFSASDASTLTLSLAQVSAVLSTTATFGDPVTLTGTGTNLAAMSTTTIGALYSHGVTAIDASDNTLSFSVAQFNALNGVTFTAADSVTISDTATNLGTLTFSALAGANVDQLTATTAISISTQNLTDLGANVKFTAASVVTLADTSTNIQGVASFGTFLTHGVDSIDATDNVLTISIAQLTALGAVTLTQSDTVTLQDTETNIHNLSGAAFNTDITKGIDVFHSTSGTLTVSTSQLGQMIHNVSGTFVDRAHFQASDTVTWASTGSDIASAGNIGSVMISAMQAGVDFVHATDGVLTLVAEQFLDITLYGGAKLVTTDNDSISDSNDNLQNLWSATGLNSLLSGSGVDTISSDDGSITITAVGAAGVEGSGAVLSADDTNTLSDTGAHIAAMTADQLAGLTAINVTGIDASDNLIDMTLAQYNALSGITIDASDAVYLKDTAANLAAMTVTDIGNTPARFSGIAVSDGQTLNLTLEQLGALATKGLALTQSDTVALHDTQANIQALSNTDLAGYVAQGVDIVSASDASTFSLTAAQVSAVYDNGAVFGSGTSVTVTGTLNLTVAEWQHAVAAGNVFSGDVHLVDTAAHIQAVSATDLQTLSATGISMIDSTSDALSLSADQATAILHQTSAGSVSFAYSDSVTVYDTGAHMTALSTPDMTALIATGADSTAFDASDNSYGPTSAWSTVSYTLASHVQNLTLTGGGNIDGTGNALNNLITGNSGNNHIDGGLGADTMAGGLGDDTYYVDNPGDVITENANEGTDTVISSITYVLGLTSNLENLTLSGSSAINGAGNTMNNVITGNDGNNNLVGNFGDDVLDGKGGVNFLYGDWGNDTYIVNSVNDHVSELYNGADAGGNDTVMSSITYGLGAYIENLVLTGSASIGGSGNELNNVLTGNSGDNQLVGNGGNDTLDGGAGTNFLYGGAGDDTYYVNSVNDHVLEVQCGIDQGGNDTVISSINYVLGAYIENLVLTGSANLNGSGNSLDNHITGNDGNNQLAGLGGNDVLDGGAGVNYLYGGAGNDTYYVHTTDDHVLEQTVAGVDDGGIDTVISDISYKLGAFIENLTLAGSASINATGNYLNNVITGNSGNNILEGRLGNDTFVFGGPSNNGLDHLTDFTSGSDKLEFHAADYGFAASHVLTSSEISFTGAAVGNHAQFVYDSASHALSWDADGSGSGTAVQLVVFDNGATPTTADFLFV